MTARTARAGIVGIAALVALSALAGCAHFVVLRDPLTASEHNDLGVAYESRGQTALATKEYRRALSLDSHLSRVWVNLGNVQAAEGQWHAAGNSFRRALREDPGDADAMNNLAIAWIRQGRSPEAARVWAERAVAVGGARDSVYRATLAEVGGHTR